MSEVELRARRVSRRVGSLHLTLNAALVPVLATALLFLESKGVIHESFALVFIVVYVLAAAWLEIQRRAGFLLLREQGERELQQYCLEGEATLERWRVARFLALGILISIALVLVLLVILAPKVSG